jgi:hypothetical protein
MPGESRLIVKANNWFLWVWVGVDAPNLLCVSAGNQGGGEQWSGAVVFLCQCLHSQAEIPFHGRKYNTLDSNAVQLWFMCVCVCVCACVQCLQESPGKSTLVARSRSFVS